MPAGGDDKLEPISVQVGRGDAFAYPAMLKKRTDFPPQVCREPGTAKDNMILTLVDVFASRDPAVAAARIQSIADPERRVWLPQRGLVGRDDAFAPTTDPSPRA